MIRFEPHSPKANTQKNADTKQKGADFSNAASRLPTPTNIVLIIIIAVGGYLTWRAWSAEQTFRQALAAAPQNGAQTFNLMQEVIRKHPKNPNYRVNHSQVDLALANVLSRPQQDPQNPEKTSTPSAQTVDTVRQLVSLSVNQAKSAVTLAPNNPTAWANLGSIYRALIGVAGGAEDWALATYQRAVSLSPNDPLLRIDLGGIYFIRKDYPNAVNQFNLAAQLKSDLPNAWYNLAQAYKANGENEKALEALQQTLAVLPADLESDREAVQKEIAQLGGEEQDEQRVPEKRLEELEEPGEASPSAKNVPPPVEVEGPPAVEEATESSEPIRITP